MPLLLSQDDLRPLIERSELLAGAFEAIEAAVLQHQRGESGRAGIVIHPLDAEHSVILYSTSSTEGMSVRAYPNVGFVQDVPDSHVWLLFDGRTGGLLAVLACDELNALRTAVPAGLAARYLAPSGARSLCMLGTGRQARAQIRTILHGVPSIERVLVWSPTRTHCVSYASEMHKALSIDVYAADTCREAVEQADIVCSAGQVRDRPAFDGKWVRPGALIISLTRGSQPVLDARIVLPALKRPEPLTPTRPEPGSGEGHQQEPLGLADIIQGVAKAREHDGQTVLFDLAAMYGWDTPMMRWAYEWASKNDIGIRFSLTSEQAGLFCAWPKI